MIKNLSYDSDESAFVNLSIPMEFTGLSSLVKLEAFGIGPNGVFFNSQTIEC